MTTFNKFEDLKVYQLSRDLNKTIFQVFRSYTSNDFGYLVNHIYKTAGSISDNIAEGFERDGTKEFVQFLSYSKGSAGELRAQLQRAMDFSLLTKDQYEDVCSQITMISSQLSNFISYLKASHLRGRKYK